MRVEPVFHAQMSLCLVGMGLSVGFIYIGFHFVKLDHEM